MTGKPRVQSPGAKTRRNEGVGEEERSDERNVKSVKRKFWKNVEGVAAVTSRAFFGFVTILFSSC